MAKGGRIDMRVRSDVKAAWQDAARKQGIGVTELIERQMSIFTRKGRSVVSSPMRGKEKAR